jgi:dolichol-phosphate mannosyltransferase
MQNNNFYVSIVVPCYNEVGNIIPLVNEIHNKLSFIKHQIIVVDDNSPDGTFNLLKDANLDYVKPILRTVDPSLAKSIRKGLEEADGNIFVIMDSDFNHQPKYLPFMIKNLEYYDCVTASRFMYGGLMDSRLRQTLSWIFNIFVRIVTRKFVTDSLYGFVAIKKETLEKINYDYVFWGYGDYCIRLMYYLQENKENILQFPVINGKRLSGESNSGFLKVFWQYTIATLRLVFGKKAEI